MSVVVAVEVGLRLGIQDLPMESAVRASRIDHAVAHPRRNKKLALGVVETEQTVCWQRLSTHHQIRSQALETEPAEEVVEEVELEVVREIRTLISSGNLHAVGTGGGAGRSTEC